MHDAVLGVGRCRAESATVCASFCFLLFVYLDAMDINFDALFDTFTDDFGEQ